MNNKIVQYKTIPSDVNLEDCPCALGCAADSRILFSGVDTQNNLSGEYTVVKCEQCGLIRTNPRPTADTMGYYYPEDYAPYQGTVVDDAVSKVARTQSPILRRIAKRILEMNIQRLPSMEAGSMLEVGCASGSFLQVMQGKGWKVDGIEFSPSAADNARKSGFDVYTGSLEEAPDPEKKYDLIVGWMVLEHLHQPLRSLKKLRMWAKQDAMLVLSVPNAGSADFMWLKHDGYALQLPNHLYLFSPNSIEKLLKMAGWKLEKIHHQRIMSNWFGGLGQHLSAQGYNNRLITWLKAYPQKAGKLHYLFFPLAWFLALFGQTGRMTVWARCSDG
jgi:2-polyprenyl-3-methyl-5-hydroxy-6-metoxy-1,4-benzoquinol methylase